MRRKYKQEYLNTLSDLKYCESRLRDCSIFISEAKKFIIDHKLAEEFNKIMNDKYGTSLYDTICKIPPAKE